MASIKDTVDSVLTALNNLLGVVDGKLRNKAERSEVYAKTEIDDPQRTLGSNAATASRLKVLRLLTLDGDASGEVGFDGSGNVTLMVTVPGLASKADVAEAVTPAQLEARLQQVIGAAPAVLDTFAELAEAMGNDPNFAASMTTALSGKADKATTYTMTAADARFLLKAGKAADASALGGNAPNYYASGASVTSLEASVADGFSRIAVAFNNGATLIKGTGA